MKPITQAPFAAVQAAASDARGRKAILYMPAGRWQITPWIGGTPQPLDVLVEPAAALAIEQQRAVLAQGGAHAYFSPSHQSSQPWFQVDGFEWATRLDKTGQEHTGIWASGSYTEAGSRGMAANVFPYFSPEFFVDNLDGKPARVVANPNARLNMGGFVDNPAFPMPPVPVQAAAGGENSAPVAAGAVADSNQPQQPNQTDMKKSWLLLNHTPAEGGGGTAAATPVQAAATPPPAAAPAAPNAIQAAEAAELAALRAEKTARIEREADAAVAVMAANGHIAPHDEAAKKQWRADFIANPALIERATKLPKALPQGQIIQAGRSDVALGAEDIKRVIQAYGAATTPEARAALWSGELRGRFKKEFDRVVQAAHSLGTVTGDLVVQQSLDLLIYQFPELSRFSFNLGSEATDFNQTIKTRLRSVRTATEFNANDGYVDGDKADTDVGVTLSKHYYDSVGFNIQQLAGTRRQLFAEEEEGMFYSVAKACVDYMYSLMTPANYANTPITSSALEFGRDKVVDGKVTLHNAKAFGPKVLLLNSTYYGQLEKDQAIVNVQNNPDAGEVFQRSRLGTIATFEVFEAGNMPNNSQNVVGFGGRADSIAIASRVPGDIQRQMPGVPAPGVITVVQHPETGLALLVTKFINLATGRASMRAELFFGAIKAQTSAGLIYRSAAV